MPPDGRAAAVIGLTLGDRASLVLVRVIASEDFHKLALASPDDPAFDDPLFPHLEEAGLETE
mgnify:CR=1 FL=1